MMANAVTILARQLRTKALDLNVGEDVSIPWIRHTDEEYSFIRKLIKMFVFLISMGKFTDKLSKDQRLLRF